MKTTFLEDSGTEELNDVRIDEVFLVSSRAYKFTFHPKSNYWRIGFRFTHDSNGVHRPITGRYNNINVAHFEVHAGNLKDGVLVDHNVLALRQDNFIQLPNNLHATNQYVPQSPVQITIYPIDDTTMDIECRSDAFDTFTKRINHGYKRYFQVYAWADYAAFKIEWVLETILVPLTIVVNKQKAIDDKKVVINLQYISILYGRNNSGKTSALLGVCSAYQDNFDDSVDYLSIDRYFSDYDYTAAADLEDSMESPNTQKKNRQKRCDNKYQSSQPFDDWARELALLKQEERDRVIEFFNSLFEEWTFTRKNQSKYKLSVEASVNGHPVVAQGTGALAALPIIIQLFNPEVQLLAIDEPELGLEPSIQKILFKAIKDASEGKNNFPKKRIILATHSHLFLDRNHITNNYRVEKLGGEVSVRQLTHLADLLDAVYTLMGSNPTDLFFPSNIIVVEGKADVIFFKAVYHKMLEMGHVKKHSLVFYPLGGLDKARFGLETIVQMLRTINEMPMFKDRLCCIFDLPDPQKKQILDHLNLFFKSDSTGRLVVLERNGVEFYYPQSFVSKIAGKSVTNEEVYEETQSFLKSFSKKGNYVGTFFGAQFTKGNLAALAAEHVDRSLDLNEIDSTIIELIQKAESLGF